MGMRYTTTPTSPRCLPATNPQKSSPTPQKKNQKNPHPGTPPVDFSLPTLLAPRGFLGDALVALLARRGDPEGIFGDVLG